MTVIRHKPIKPADVEKLRALAERLNDTWSPRVRMEIQQNFVREMTLRYGHEYATVMLTRAWRLAGRMQKGEQKYG